MSGCAGKQKQSVNESNRQRKYGRLLLLLGIKEASNITTLYHLPMEILDVILQKSYLHWILNTQSKQRDKEVIRSFISVDVCFNRRITRKRFKKAIWRYLKNFYEQTKKRSAIIRNNRNYLLKTIQPNYEFISSLLSLNCVTEEQWYFIERQSSKRDKNVELLKIMRSVNVTQFSNFVNCLLEANQTDVARVISTGGVVVKVAVRNCGGECAEKIGLSAQLAHQRLKDLRNEIALKSLKTNKCFRKLQNKDPEILKPQLKIWTVIVWIWCRTQAALEHIQNLYESNQMWEVFFDHIQPSTSMVLRIEKSQFKKSVEVYPISTKMHFTQRIVTRVNEYVWGVTKLRNEIFVLCRVFSPARNVIRVFENRNPIRFRREIKVEQITNPFDIGSSEKENCIYVSDSVNHCIWKITKEKGDGNKVMKWLTTDHRPKTISVSFDGSLLMVNDKSPILMIYGLDAELIRSIHLPIDIKNPIHAVETSIGNFMILHLWKENAERLRPSHVVYSPTDWVVSELTRDGQEVIRRFIPENKEQELNDPSYIALDSDDQVFVADRDNDRVILLDLYLEWNQIICPSREDLTDTDCLPWRLFYDKETKQLIVGGFFRDIIIYTLSEN